MRSWGSRSIRVRAQLHPDLQRVVDYILAEICDVSLICGHRGEEEQNAAYRSKHSKVQWPNSRHNTLPSLAVDLQPYPYPSEPQELREQLSYMAGRAITWAKSEGIDLRWGGDWDQDGDLTDNSFDDLFHFEIRVS